jgi:hypothetical protein
LLLRLRLALLLRTLLLFPPLLSLAFLFRALFRLALLFSALPFLLLLLEFSMSERLLKVRMTRRSLPDPAICV